MRLKNRNIEKKKNLGGGDGVKWEEKQTDDRLLLHFPTLCGLENGSF